MPQNPPAKQSRKSHLRKSTRQPVAVQTAIAIHAASGMNKTEIAEELGLSRGTVSSVMELNAVEQQLEDIRNSAIALGPLAVAAIQDDLATGNGTLGLRLLESVGAIGPDSIRPKQDHSRNSAAINVLVQSGATVALGNGNTTVQQNGTPGPPVSPTVPGRDTTVAVQNSTVTTKVSHNTATAQQAHGQPLTGEQPKRGPGSK